MKNHSNRILTVFFAVSLVVSISLFLVRAVAFPFEIYGAIEICAFYFPAVPFLFLQMLLCKAVQKKWVRFLPLLAVAIVAMVAAVGCATASGWDTLGYLILLFLKISNGATFFKDLDYGQWGFHILSLAELSEIQSKVTTWGYDLKPEWLPFVTCLGDCDILLFDLNRYEQNNTNYILYGDQEERVENWAYIKGGFQKWIDRLIVSQGSKYWSWF